MDAIVNLRTRYDRGKVVPGYPDIRFVVLQRRQKAHGHVVVYRISEDTVRVLHVFHTAQDWQSKLSSEIEE
jgi:plasmid stabilization system protein ParE